MLTLLDGILIVIMLISALLAMVRGFVREVLSIASWVIAAIVAFLFYDDLLPFTQNYISNEWIALAATVAALFFVTLLLVSFVTMRISDLVLDSRVGALDRTLGFVFGAARGLLLVVVGVLFFNWFVPEPDSQPRWVAEAKSKPMLDAIADQLLAALPEDPEGELLGRFFGDDDTEPAAEDTPNDVAPDAAATPGAGTVTDPNDPPAQPRIDETDRQRLDQLLGTTPGV